MKQGVLIAGAIAGFGAVAGLAGCHRREAAVSPAPSAHYTVGSAWQGADGAWFYPKEASDYRATGLAVVQSSGRAGSTADGEAPDPGSLSAAMQTLQLPSVVRVTNLENGRQLLVRVNDRGPADQGRIIALSSHAADLLGMAGGAATRVRVEEDAALSRRVVDQIGGGPRLDIKAAPVVGVQEQSLSGPPGSAASDAPASGVDAAAVADDAPVTLPDQASQGAAERGSLWIDAGQFTTRDYAEQVAANLGGSVRADGFGRQTVYLVRQGPFDRVTDADAALDHARRAGVTGARIIVE